MPFNHLIVLDAGMSEDIKCHNRDSPCLEHRERHRGASASVSQDMHVVNVARQLSCAPWSDRGSLIRCDVTPDLFLPDWCAASARMRPDLARTTHLSINFLKSELGSVNHSASTAARRMAFTGLSVFRALMDWSIVHRAVLLPTYGSFAPLLCDIVRPFLVLSDAAPPKSTLDPGSMCNSAYGRPSTSSGKGSSGLACLYTHCSHGWGVVIPVSPSP